MCERIDGQADARQTPIGWVPAEKDLDLTGLQIPDESLHELLKVDNAGWKAELPGIEKFFDMFGERLPARLRAQLEGLRQRLG